MLRRRNSFRCGVERATVHMSAICVTRRRAQSAMGRTPLRRQTFFGRVRAGVADGARDAVHEHDGHGAFGDDRAISGARHGKNLEPFFQEIEVKLSLVLSFFEVVE